VNGGLVGLEYSKQSARFVPVTDGTYLLRKDFPVQFDYILSHLILSAESFLRRVERHAPRDFSGLSEQFNRNTGFMQGTIQLTLSHASILAVTFVRDDLHTDLLHY
jgi:GH15 family glucan-1,4-alpha-glucosidase